MSVWDSYPADYRSKEIQAILRAVRAGESISLIGLSGSGKSNLLGFLGDRWPLPEEVDDIEFILIDCNRFAKDDPEEIITRIIPLLQSRMTNASERASLSETVGDFLAEKNKKLCLLFDRFELIQSSNHQGVFNGLRALRDDHKYQLVYLLASRSPLPDDNELAELFYAHTIWLGPMKRADAEWNLCRYVERIGAQWGRDVVETLIDLSKGYPSMLRGLCEAYAAMESLDEKDLLSHPAVQGRVREFWLDSPDEQAIISSGLKGHRMLSMHRPFEFDTSELTAKEHSLLVHLISKPSAVCGKDEIIQAVWPEDKVFQEGVRDENLAQLIRRLRKKIEPDPAAPRFIHTVPGRGYRFEP